MASQTTRVQVIFLTIQPLRPSLKQDNVVYTGLMWGARRVVHPLFGLKGNRNMWILLFLLFPLLGGAQTVLTISGDIPTTVALKLEDLATMPRETVTVEDQDGAKVAYTGVLLREVLDRAGAPLGKKLRGKALSTYILAKAKDGYEVMFTLGELDTA